MARTAFALLLALPLISGCDTMDSHTARKAQVELVGTAKPDFYACAGLPNRTQMVGAAEYDTWDFQPYVSSGFGASLPLIGAINLGSSGNCHATAQIVDGKVAAVTYAGDTGGLLGHVSECATIVSHCLDGAKEATGKFN